MHFSDWLNSTELSPAAIARSLGLSRSMIYNYAAKKNMPTIPVAKRIEDFTKGEVTLYDWDHSEPGLNDLI